MYNSINPGTLFPSTTNQAPHGCSLRTDHLLALHDNVQEISLGNSYFSCFTGDSYLKGKNGKYCAGYGIVTPFEVTEAESLPLATSAQQAELYPTQASV